MKKFVAIASTGLAIGFAVALANADDSPGTASNSANSADTSQAGTAGTDTSTTTTTTTGAAPTDQAQPMNPTASAKQSKDAMQAELKNAKSCVDESGVTYKKGEKGFKHCIQSKMRQSEQMGGTTPPADQSAPSGMSQSGGSDTGSTSSGSTSTGSSGS